MKIETWEQLDQASRYSDYGAPIDLDAVVSDTQEFFGDQVKDAELRIEELEQICIDSSNHIDAIIKTIEAHPFAANFKDVISKLKDISNELGYI